jgi:hypothetical protein
MAEKGVSHGAFAQGGAGASASEGAPYTFDQPPATAESRLSYRKLKFLFDQPKRRKSGLILKTLQAGLFSFRKRVATQG